jgi:hypothetical protein
MSMAVFDELRDLLVSMGDECDVVAFVDQPDERWMRHRLSQMRKMQSWFLR